MIVPALDKVYDIIKHVERLTEIDVMKNATHSGTQADDGKMTTAFRYIYLIRLPYFDTEHMNHVYHDVVYFSSCCHILFIHSRQKYHSYQTLSSQTTYISSCQDI